MKAALLHFAVTIPSNTQTLLEVPLAGLLRQRKLPPANGRQAGQFASSPAVGAVRMPCGYRFASPETGRPALPKASTGVTVKRTLPFGSASRGKSQTTGRVSFASLMQNPGE